MQENSSIARINYSVVIPYFNSEGTLTRLLDSIPKRADIQVIVVDDLSDDGSFKSISSICKYAHVTFVQLTSKRYAGGARNEGLGIATGRWVLFADADDYFTPDAFGVLDGFLDATDDVLIFKANAVIDQTSQRSKRNDKNLRFHRIGGILGALGIVTPWAKLYRRQFLDANLLKFSEVVAANDVFFSRSVALAAKRIQFIDSIVYTVTDSEGSLTKQTSETHFLSRLIEHRRSVEEVRRSERINMAVFSFYLGNYLHFVVNGTKTAEYKTEFRKLEKVLGVNVCTAMLGSLYNCLYMVSRKIG